MALAAERFVDTDDIHPIDIAETIASRHAWEAERLADDQMAMVIDGQWRSYSITLAWSARESVLRIVCTFDFDPPEGRTADLYEVMNLVNDEIWDGSFTWWGPQKLMVWRYGLVLTGNAMVEPAQVEHMIAAAVSGSERFYPAMQLACWGERTPAQALDIAMSDAYGRA